MLIWLQEWLLKGPIYTKIRLTFESFELEDSTSCKYDWVEVSYGNKSEKFCGKSIPGPLTSTGPNMTVRMHTDSSQTRTGFKAVWTSYWGPTVPPTPLVIPYFLDPTGYLGKMRVIVRTSLGWGLCVLPLFYNLYFIF